MKNSLIIIVLMFALNMNHCLKASENTGQTSQELERLQQLELYSTKAMKNYYRQERYLDAVLTFRKMLSNVFGIYDDKDDSYFVDFTNSSYREIVEYVEYLIEHLDVNRSRFLLLVGWDDEFIEKDQYKTPLAGLINLLHTIQASCAEKHGDYAKALATYVKCKDYLSYLIDRATPRTAFLTVDDDTFREVEIPGAVSPEVLQQLRESEKWIDEQIVKLANKLGVESKLYLGEEENQSQDQDYGEIPTITIDWPQAEKSSDDNN